MDDGTRGFRFKRRAVDTIIRGAGWHLPTKFLERLRDFASYALGAGSASLPIDQSGERKLLERLALLWISHDEIRVVDVGAHHGDYARAALAAFGERAYIHCFEPAPATFQALARNMQAYPRVHCHQVALGEAAGHATLFSDQRNSVLASLHPETFKFKSASKPAVHRDEVTVETLDRVAPRLGIERIDLLKVDVEGHETAVLKGATQLLEQEGISVVQFEFGERSLASRSYLRDFVDLLGPAYELYRVSPRGLARVDYGAGSEVFLAETNYVAMRRPASSS